MDGLAPEHHNGSGTIKKSPSVISNQLRDELIRILSAGDVKRDGAFTVAVAVHVEKFAASAREILMTENLAQNDLGSLMAMRKHHPSGAWSGVLGDGSVMPLPLGSLGSSSMSNNENFGVQAVRQIVDAIRTKDGSPAKLVEALAAARSHNLTDVAAALEDKLGMPAKQLSVDNEQHDEAAS